MPGKFRPLCERILTRNSEIAIFYTHLQGTCSTLSCLQLTPADCGICLAFMSPPVRDRHNSFNLMRTCLGSILLHISLVWRSFTDLSEWIRSANSRWLSQSLATFGKRCIRQAWRKSYSLFFNYALSRLAIPPSISSWCFNNWKMVERSIVGALLVQKWLARDQFLRSTNGKLCNLFNCLLPLVQTIVFEFCRTSTEILGPNWKSSCLDVCGTLASHAYLLFGTGMSESKSVAIFNYLVNIFDMANHACFICRTSSRGSVSARQPYAWIMYNASWEFKPRTARRGSEQPWTRIRQSGDIHSLRIMGAKLHGGVGQCLLQVLNHGQRWLGCIGKQRDGKSWKTMVGRLYKKAHGRPGLNWKTTCAIELFLVAWDPGSRTCRVFKSHERGIFLYCNATK